MDLYQGPKKVAIERRIVPDNGVKSEESDDWTDSSNDQMSLSSGFSSSDSESEED